MIRPIKAHFHEKMVDLVMLILLLKNGRPSHVNLTPKKMVDLVVLILLLKKW